MECNDSLDSLTKVVDDYYKKIPNDAIDNIQHELDLLNLLIDINGNDFVEQKLVTIIKYINKVKKKTYQRSICIRSHSLI